MKSEFESALARSRHRLIKRWVIGAAIFYGLISVGMAALIMIGINSANRAVNADESMANSDLGEFTVPITPKKRHQTANSIQ
jgi:hypothetical protein